MSEAVLSGADGQLPPREAALARFAAMLTAEPWAVSREVVVELAGHGLDRTAVQAAVGVVAMFNYLTRVADASGIDFDYHSPLPAFVPDREHRAPARPDRSTWPEVPRAVTGFPGAAGIWQDWCDYVFESEQPLRRRERQVLARAAAQECCDRWRADQLVGFAPGNDTEALLADFAGKLSREPWRMEPADLDRLRAAGYSEVALLHAISVVALQNAESRLAMGRALLGPQERRH
jgi:alkylhydroperoxidase family enzyme